MKNKKKYFKPFGKFLLIITEDCLCNASGEAGEDDDVFVEDWEDGGGGYGYGDL